MTSLLIAASIALIGQNPPVQDEPAKASPGQIISNMISKLYDAKTLTGTIRFTVQVSGDSVVTDTTVQYEKPSKMYIKQVRGGFEPKTWLVTCDGKIITYSAPKLPWMDKGERLAEPVKQGDKVLSVRELYGIVTQSLGDRSAPLDLVFGRTEDLQYLRNQWATLEYKGIETVNGEEVHVILGDWREYGEAKISGRFRMYINKTFDLRQYALSEMMAPDTRSNAVQLTSLWDVKLEINGKPNPDLFRVVK